MGSSWVFETRAENKYGNEDKFVRKACRKGYENCNFSTDLGNTICRKRWNDCLYNIERSKHVDE